MDKVRTKEMGQWPANCRRWLIKRRVYERRNRKKKETVWNLGPNMSQDTSYIVPLVALFYFMKCYRCTFAFPKGLYRDDGGNSSSEMMVNLYMGRGIIHDVTAILMFSHWRNWYLIFVWFKISALSDFTPYNTVEVRELFGGTYCFQIQSEEKYTKRSCQSGWALWTRLKYYTCL